MYEKCLYGGHFEKQNVGYFLFFEKNGDINFRILEYQKM